MEYVDAAVNFYIEPLSFETVMQAGSAFARMAKEGLTLWIAGPKVPPSRPIPDCNVPKPGVWHRFVFEVGDIKVVVASLKQAGVNFRYATVSGVDRKQILAEDPSGNAIELFQAT